MKHKYLQIVKLKKSTEEQIFSVLCAGIAFSITFGAIINSLLCILVLLFWIFFQEKEFNIYQSKTRFFILLSSLFIMALVGLLYSENMKEGVFRVQQKTALMLFPLVLGTTKVNYRKFLVPVSISFILGVFANCIFCLISASIMYFKNHSIKAFYGHNLSFYSNTYTYILAICCLISIILLINFIQKNNGSTISQKIKTVVICCIVFFCSYIFLLGVLQVVLSLIICTVFYIITFFKSKKTAIYAIIATIFSFCLIIVLTPVLKQKAQSFINISKNYIPLDTDASLSKSWDGIAIRLAIWQCSKSVVIPNLIIGVGTGDVQDKLQQVYENRKFYFASRYNKYNAHNQYLQTLISSGIIGLIILLACLTVPLFYIKREPIYIAFCIIMILCFLTESILETNKGIILYSFFNSLFIFSKLESKS